MEQQQHLDVVILGAGVSGLCMGIKLIEAGVPSFAIFEKSQDVGGTWLDNSYPGAGCDVPSHLYSFSFEPNPEWSRAFSPQPEIQRYLRRCAEKYDLLTRIRFGTEIAGARFDEHAGLWHIRTSTGEEITAKALVSGLGQLNRPHVPDLPGLASFEGTSFHSARWDHQHDLAGERVAVIGNGASALQFIPEIAKTAQRVTVFQRSANWVIPRNDRKFSEADKARFRRHPLLVRALRAFIWSMLEIRFLAFLRESWFSRRMTRMATAYLHAQVSDPVLRAKLTPDYPIGCKRILISDDYYQALVRPNVEVVTESIERVTQHEVVTKDGVARPADTIVFGTGFETTGFLAPLTIEGLGGAKLDEIWRDGATAYLGLTVAGFPNLFLLYGPNTNLGHNSIIFMIECQVGYAVQCIAELRRRHASWLDVRRDVMDGYNHRLQAALAKTTWTAGCSSWYKTASGKVVNNWSGFTTDYWRRTRHPNWRDYRFVRA
jgi:cation diffusion facilitator CzcD-associated flavoprotein CzcO